MHLAEVVPADGEHLEEVLALAAAAERGSEHPIARAVVEGALARGLSIPSATGFAIEPGAGARAMVEGQIVEVGRSDHLPPSLAERASALAAGGQTVFAVRRGGRPVGVVAVSDQVKAGAAEAVARLRGLGLEAGLVTGDRRVTAEAVARRAGISRVVAEVYPEGKVEEVRGLQRAGRRLVFVGDGINDVRRWPRPMSVSLWEPAPTWPSRRPMSPF